MTICIKCYLVCACSRVRPDLTKAALDARNEQIHFPPPVDSFVHQLTTDGYFTVQSRGLSGIH